jgi:putative addiction module component (TIGR02574 family)
MSHGPSQGDIERLTVAERLELIGTLWDSVPASPEALPVPEWHQEELDRRLAKADAAPDESVPWEQVKSRLLGEP